jgi:hypothetical protein
MDVVDTLRHDRRIVERELNDESRREDLIERLRRIYAEQGIEVSDAILAEGVRALEEDRFRYSPPEPGFASTLARFYVTRHQWGRYVIGALGVIVAFFAVNYFLHTRPAQLREQAVREELSDRLPQRLRKLAADIKSEAEDPSLAERASGVMQAGLNAARSGDAQPARQAESELTDMLEKLRRVYEIRIVSRAGELSGLWRTPSVNPDSYNYYLVVEAIGPDGKVIPLPIENEETGKRETVRTWAKRVTRGVLERVRDDKADDGIIRNPVVGRKQRGRLEPDWTVDVAGGAITRW